MDGNGMDVDELFERVLPTFRKAIAWQMIVFAKRNLPGAIQMIESLARRVAEDRWD